MYDQPKTQVKVTVYNALGKIFKEVLFDGYPSHYTWPAVILHGNEVLSLPSIVVEPVEVSSEKLCLIDEDPHTVDLIAYDGSIVRSWTTRDKPACLKERTVFIPDDRIEEVWAFGHYHIRRVEF